MSEIRNLTRNGETFYPLTHIEAVLDESGTPLGVDDVPTEDSDKLVRSGSVYEELTGKVNLGDIIGDPTGTWEQSSAEEYIDTKIAEQNNKINLNKNLISQESATRRNRDSELESLINAGIRAGEGVVFDTTPTSGSVNAVTSNGIHEAIYNDPGVYNVTLHHPTSGVSGGATYTLQGAYGVVPSTVQRGGLTLKFIGSESSKYEYYRLTTASWPVSFSASDWESLNIDDVPTAGSVNLVTSDGIAGSIVYDISAAHSGATYINLTAALGTNGINVPESIRKGGMSIKFIQSSDNKYVQYRLMSDSFNTTVANWQGVDDDLTPYSPDVAKSGVVFEKLYNYLDNTLLLSNGNTTSNADCITMLDKISVVAGHSLLLNYPVTSRYVVFYNSNGEYLSYTNVAYNPMTVPENAAFAKTSFLKSNIKEAFIFDITTSKYLFIPKGDVTIDKINEKVFYNNYIPGFINAGNISASINYMIPFPYILAAAGDTIKWDNTNAFYHIACYDSNDVYIAHKSATGYTSWVLPENTHHIKVGFKKEYGGWVKVNDVYVWRNAHAKTISGISTDLSILEAKQKENENNINSVVQDVDTALSNLSNYTVGIRYITNGNQVADPDAFVPNDKIPCSYGDIITGWNGKGHLIIFNSSNAVLGYAAFTDELPNRTISLTTSTYENAAYCRCTFALNKIKKAKVTNKYGEVLWVANSAALGNNEAKMIASNAISINNDFEGVVDWYKDHILAKCAEIFKKDVAYKNNGDSFIYLTDYHIPDVGVSGITQFRHSPALVRYIQRNTNTKKFVFGGDSVCSPTDAERYERMRAFISDFKETSMYPVVGNHEWQNSSFTGLDALAKDYATFCSNLDVNFSTQKIPCYYFDNVKMKIRYIVLYTPKTADTNYINYETYQLPFLREKALEVGNDWGIVVFQHIIGQVYQSTFDENDEPTSLSYTSIKELLIPYLNLLTTEQNCPKILGVIAGHAHCDWIDYSEKGYPIIITTDDGTYTVVNGSPDKVYPVQHKREIETINEQAFDVMHIDLTGNVFDITRIGYGKNRLVRLNTINLLVGNSVEITPIISAIDGDSLSWYSNNTDIAAVNNGTVSGVAAGHTWVRIANASQYSNQTDWEYIHIVVE